MRRHWRHCTRTLLRRGRRAPGPPQLALPAGRAGAPVGAGGIPAGVRGRRRKSPAQGQRGAEGLLLFFFFRSPRGAHSRCRLW